jgi:hypothetical protein
MHSALARELRDRLPDREELSPAALHAQFWAALSQNDVFRLFDLIQQELGIPVGLLRPEDNLDRLLSPVSIRRPLRWFRIEPALEDATSELNYQLKLRLQGRPLPAAFRVRTLDELARVWCRSYPA